MSGINKYFKKTPNSIEQAFLRQSKSNENTEPPSTWTNEKKILEDKIGILQTENQDMRQKYDKLKSKHVKLLQVLFEMEKKHQNLEMNKFQGNTHEKRPSDANKSPTTEYDFDVPTHLVSIYFSLNVSFVCFC